jgi:hypothetical protein
MSWDPDPEHPTRTAANGFGLRSLFFGEWCRDRWRPSHEPSSPENLDEWVVRGGAARFWPWQDEEWVGAMSAMRMPSSRTGGAPCAFRVVRLMPS